MTHPTPEPPGKEAEVIPFPSVPLPQEREQQETEEATEATDTGSDVEHVSEVVDGEIVTEPAPATTEVAVPDHETPTRRAARTAARTAARHAARSPLYAATGAWYTTRGTAIMTAHLVRWIAASDDYRELIRDDRAAGKHKDALRHRQEQAAMRKRRAKAAGYGALVGTAGVGAAAVWLGPAMLGAIALVYVVAAYLVGRPAPTPQLTTGPTARRATANIVGATAAENRILAVLSDWDSQAKARGLAGLSIAGVELDDSGLRVTLTLAGTWTTEKVRKASDRLRAMLSVPTETRMEVTHGESGDEAVVRLRTRQKALDTLWSPTVKGIGLDTDTGDVVELPKGRKLIAGTSGAGKSVLVRVIMAAALTDPEPTAVVYIDGKGEESALWEDKVTIAVEPDEICEVIDALVAEGNRRRDIMRSKKVATWTPTAEAPRLVVVVDEGAEVIAMDSRKHPMLAGLQTLSRTGRSRCIDVVWCTQKPTIGDGIDKQINGIMEIRAVLRTAGETETRQVLGTGWANHTWTGAGICVVKGTDRDADQAPVAVWNLSDDATVRNLPAAQHWNQAPDTGERPELPEILALALELSDGQPGVHTSTLAEAAGMSETEVTAAMRDAGARPAPNAIRVAGDRARGYYREDLETTADSYRE